MFHKLYFVITILTLLCSVYSGQYRNRFKGQNNRFDGMLRDGRIKRAVRGEYDVKIHREGERVALQCSSDVK